MALRCLYKTLSATFAAGCALGLPALAARAQQPPPGDARPPLVPQTAPTDDQPIPHTTTEEPLVNSIGLSDTARTGWQNDFIGPWRGHFDVSFGAKFWYNRFYLRNFIFGGLVDLAPGLRARLQLRRREGEKRAFQVDTDEAYFEAFNLHRGPDWEGGVSLRAGRVRYLHFPYPDAIAEFDQVPGIVDLYGGIHTDYRDLVLEGEAATMGGWGAHFTGQARAWSGSSFPSDVIEAYGFYRSTFGRGWHFEGRAGDLARRFEPLGRSGEPGAVAYLGKQLGEFNVGILYEHKQKEHEFAGIMVQFRSNPVTRALGYVSFDYSRKPEGFTVQVPLWHAAFNQSHIIRPGEILVGEVRAVRVRTLWQQGFVRNEYEHRLESWGETASPRLHCVVEEEPWYLQAEALVSPHLVPNATWERDRMGPGQFVQRVTYRYYRPYKQPGAGTSSASGATNLRSVQVTARPVAAKKTTGTLRSVQVAAKPGVPARPSGTSRSVQRDEPPIPPRKTAGVVESVPVPPQRPEGARTSVAAPRIPAPIKPPTPAAPAASLRSVQVEAKQGLAAKTSGALQSVQVQAHPGSLAKAAGALQSV
ncbi:MAG TPA: hypothetical protein VKT32_01630, partial [Chthonomonadaceae bacterium]|nr:hypothetical protein [Chthonomonadaceae bacterium]